MIYIIISKHNKQRGRKMTIPFEEYNEILKEKTKLLEMLSEQIEEHKKLMKK